jgi:alpha-beta hydrolase superfamily lysophospholipase
VPASTATSKKKLPLAAKLLIPVGAVLILATVGVAIASILPTDVARLSVQYPPIEDRSARKHAGSGCALNEMGAPGSCRKAVVTSVRDEEVTFPSSIPDKGLSKLKGTLSIPVGIEGRRPAIILVHGRGPNSRHEEVRGDLVSRLAAPVKVFDQLDDFFVHQGLVVLRYDKRVPQFYPDMDRSKLRAFRWSDLETDARDALAFLATRPEVDGDALIVAGHSEGGQLAPFVANDNPRVVAVIMLAGVLDDFEVGLLGQLERLAEARSAQWDFIGAWATRQEKKKYAPCFEKLRRHYEPDEMCIGGGVTQAALQDYLRYAARMPAVLAAGTSPVMAIQGSVDRNIDPEAIPKVGKALGARDHELHYVPGVSHDLVNVVTPTRPPAVDAEVERRIAEFLSSVRRPA